MTGAAADAPRPLLQACPGRRASLPSSVAAIARCDDGYVVAAEMVAEHFGLTADAFWREMQRGIVYGVVERGEGEDAGRTRLTIRYRARSWSMTLEETA